tara:strand:+ start:240 stop:608 length:369 start_codon:yes stop_codon:yes gene_type:complete
MLKQTNFTSLSFADTLPSMLVQTNHNRYTPTQKGGCEFSCSWEPPSPPPLGGVRVKSEPLDYTLLKYPLQEPQQSMYISSISHNQRLPPIANGHQSCVVVVVPLYGTEALYWRNVKRSENVG